MHGYESYTWLTMSHILCVTKWIILSDHRHPKGMWPTSNKQIHQKLMDQYDEKLPEMFADGSSVSNEEKAVLHMDLNYNLRIGFRKTWYLFEDRSFSRLFGRLTPQVDPSLWLKTVHFRLELSRIRLKFFERTALEEEIRMVYSETYCRILNHFTA